MAAVIYALMAITSVASVASPAGHVVKNHEHTSVKSLADVHVSPTGSDTGGDGSAQHPFATLGRAQAAARSLVHSQMSAVTVRIGAGMYFMDTPLTLNESLDSNTSWVGEDTASTWVRGGRRVANWEPAPESFPFPVATGSQVWRAINPWPGRPFHHLVENSKPATPARFPNKGAGWLYNWTGTTIDGRPGLWWTNDTGLPATFDDTHAKAYVWHPYGYSELTGLANVSFANRRAALWPIPHIMLVKVHLEGAAEFVDAPGEWALDRTDTWIYFVPSAPGADPNSMSITASLAPRVFDIRGADSTEQGVLRNIVIANLSICGSGWLPNFESEWANRMNSQPGRDPTKMWANTREGMVRIENASTVKVSGCALLAAGTSAVWLEHYAQHVTVENNWIEYVSAWGVHTNGWDIGGGKQPIPGSFPFASAVDANVSFGHVIRNNLIRHVGLHVTYGSGVYVHQSANVVVVNNEIAWSPRNLLSTFGLVYLYGSAFANHTYPDDPPTIYGERMTYFTQYDVTTSNNLTFAYNDLSHACGDSQDCGVWEAWGPGRDNRLIANSVHDHWAPMGQAFTILFPDSGNNFFTVKQNVLFNNLASGEAGRSPGGSTGMTAIGLKGYNQNFTDNVIADSSITVGVWVGQSGGFGVGAVSVARNVFFNFSSAPQCGAGEYSQANASLCYRDLPMIASSTVGESLNASCLAGVCGNATAPVTAKASCINPEWYGFDAVQLSQAILVEVDANLYQGDVGDAASEMAKLRPDVDRSSIGGVTNPQFVRTRYSQWWNRTHLDYGLAPTSAAVTRVGVQQANLSVIGLDLSEWPFDHDAVGVRDGSATIQTESADRVFGLYLEPSFGVSFPTNPGPLAPVGSTAFAKYGKVDFLTMFKDVGPKTVRLRACLPHPGAGVIPATAVSLRLGSPDGVLMARVALDPALLAHAHCGYLIGSYWLPGTQNDDPTAMTEIVASLEPLNSRDLGTTTDVYMSVEGGGHVAIDWLRFEKGQNRTA